MAIVWRTRSPLLCVSAPWSMVLAVLRQLSMFRGAPAGRANEPSTPIVRIPLTGVFGRYERRVDARVVESTVTEKACDADPTFISTL